VPQAAFFGSGNVSDDWFVAEVITADALLKGHVSVDYAITH
jgi:hypothetical protein